jgi:hypothetical protein
VIVVLSGLVRFHGLLRNQIHPSLLVRLNANSFFIHKSSMSSGVLVGEIHRIARELDTAARSALHEVRILISFESNQLPGFDLEGADLRTISQTRSAETFERSDILFRCLLVEDHER